MVIGWDSPIISETRRTSLVAIMRAQRNYGDIDFEVVNLVDHAVLLIDAPAPQSSTALKEELRKP